MSDRPRRIKALEAATGGGPPSWPPPPRTLSPAEVRGILDEVVEDLSRRGRPVDPVALRATLAEGGPVALTGEAGELVAFLCYWRARGLHVLTSDTNP